MTDAGPETFRALFGQVGTPMVLLDGNLAVCRANDALATALDRNQSDLVGASLDELTSERVDVEDIQTTLRDGTVWRGSVDLLTARGAIVCASGSISPIQADADSVEFVGVFVDTTRQRHVENASEVMNRFLRHDLRNDLNLVTGYIEEAEEFIESERALSELDRTRSAVDDIVHKCKRARELRQLFRGQSDGADATVELSTLLHEELVDAMGRFGRARFTYGQFPEVWVRGDEMLGTVFEAILENAVSHSDQANPVVEVSVQEQPGTVRVRIADDGPGVPDERKELIFGREEVDQLHHGSGISLFLADCIVDSYGGDIWVEDSDPRGAAFVVELVRA